MALNPEKWPVNLETKPKVAVAAWGVMEKACVTRHYVPKFWCLHLYNYSGELRANNRLLSIRPRHAGILPPAVHLEYRFSGPSTHLYAHFHLPPIKASLLHAPVMINMGGDYEIIYRDFERAIGLLVRWPTCADAIIWNILWRIAEKQWKEPNNPARPHPAVEKTIEFIERRLHEPLSGEDLAREVNLSHHHLIRIFHATVGITPRQYLRKQRVLRANHLLQNSTLSIKAIAADVGIPDLHLFNKTIRRLLGRPPSQLRLVKEKRRF